MGAAMGAPMGVQLGGNVKQKLCVFCNVLRFFHRRYIQIIGLKAPGNCSDQFGSNNFSILLCEVPKPPNSMIS